MSWAAIAKSATAPVAPTELPAPRADERVAVIDTNAIISGLRLEQLAERFCTIPEVLVEVRDKQSRTFLSTLPFSLDVREPSEESVKAVQRFARETGDIHSLSAVDLKLLALCHSLEVAAHGTGHLREHPVQIRTRQKHKTRPRALPGWGAVPNPSDWRVVDEAPEEQLSNATGGAGAQSRIIAAVQSLTLGDVDGSVRPAGAVPPPPLPSLFPPPLGTEGAPTLGNGGGPLPSLPMPEPPQDGAVLQTPLQQSVEGAGGADGPTTFTRLAEGAGGVVQEAAAQEAHEHGSDEDEDEGEEGDDGEWETAFKSRNAARRRQRRQRRWESWQEQKQQQGQRPGQKGEVSSAPAAVVPTPAASGKSGWDWGLGGVGVTAAFGNEQGTTEGGKEVEGAAPAAAEAVPAAVDDSGTQRDAAAAAVESSDEGVEEEDGDGEEEGEGEGFELVTDDGEDEADGTTYDEDGAASEAGTTVTDVTAAASLAGMTMTMLTETVGNGTSVAGEVLEDGQLAPNTTSNVFCVTADFAMQNVMLQMGLRLVTRDGKQITRVSRWALRCSACFFVSKEVGRQFCPRCGNMTMERVEVMVGPGGAEFYGVRKKFILRGTRYSLPKPKGGRGAKANPVLREDVFLARQGGRTRPKAAASAGAAAGEVDPFAPEFGMETWHKAGGRAGGRGGGLALTSWKNNPNEVKPQRKSRRK